MVPSFDFNKYRQIARLEGGVLPRITCADGFSVSVQARKFNYCSPREDNAEHYTAVEAGFPSAEEPLLTPYAEDGGDLTQTVYGWVPVEVINEVINKHGGWAVPKEDTRLGVAFSLLTLSMR